MLQQITYDNFNQMLGQFSTGELESLLQKSPYFQQAHLLLAKKYQLENNPKFDQQLQLAALYTQDRELLFKIFYKTPAEEVVVTPVFEQQAVQEVVIPEVVIEATVTEPQKIELPDALIEAIEAQDNVAEIIADEPLAAQFLLTEQHSFDEWLRVFNKQPIAEPQTQDKTAEEMDEELNKLVMQNVPVNYLQELMEGETRYSKGLDEFIEEQKEKHKQAYVKPVGEKDLDPEMITETMARVYEMQKKYHKAIKAYEILTLKIPEKSDFFAARISYLKNII